MTGATPGANKRDDFNYKNIWGIRREQNQYLFDGRWTQKAKTSAQKWLKNYLEIDVVFLTGLESNWNKKEIRNTSFSLEDLQKYLQEMQGQENCSAIKEYFTKTPPQIKTQGRSLFDTKFQEK